MSRAATEVIAAAQAEIERLTEEADGLVATILEAVEMAEQIRDLLLERIHGTPAISPAHNARMRADTLIALLTAKTAAPRVAMCQTEEGCGEFAECFQADRCVHYTSTAPAVVATPIDWSMQSAAWPTDIAVPLRRVER